MSPDKAVSGSQSRLVRGVPISYSTLGSGPLVINAHGLSASRANNAHMGLPDYSEIAELGRQLVSYDARGHGLSGGTPRAEDYTWSALADDLLALADLLSPRAPIAAIGCSMGTGTLLHAATRKPERFTSLVLTAPPTAWQTRAAQADVYRAMAEVFETSRPEAVRELFAQAPVAVPPVFADIPGYPAAPDIAFELLPEVFRGAGRSDLPSPDLISTIELPTLILAWAGDPGHPVSTAERLAEILPNAQMHVTGTHEDLLTWGARAASFIAAH